MRPFFSTLVASCLLIRQSEIHDVYARDEVRFKFCAGRVSRPLVERLSGFLHDAPASAARGLALPLQQPVIGIWRDVALQAIRIV